MAQRIQESIPEQLYTNINLHSDSENILNDSVITTIKDEFPAASSELKTSRKSNSLQRFFWRKKTDSDDGPVDVDNKSESTLKSQDSERRFLHSTRMHLHLGRNIARKRSDTLPKREHGEMDLLKKSSSVSKANNNNENRGSGLRAYFATYWNYIFSKNKNNVEDIDEIYEKAKPSQTDETENKLKSVITSSQNTENIENRNIVTASE